jgi:hypothetical protein
MGLIQEYINFIDECILMTLGSLSGKRMLELGNQRLQDARFSEKTGKEYFTNRGVHHISVDLNGEDEAIPLDLTKPEQFLRWKDYFDIITNAGTSEHVEPKQAQYNCFLIVHNCLSIGGIAIHIVPDKKELIEKGCWKEHCNNYYSTDFFHMLATNNNYKLTKIDIINGLVCACLQKTQASVFMENRDEFLRNIHREEGGTVYPGINDI